MPKQPKQPKRQRAHPIGAEMPVVNLTTMSKRRRKAPKPLPRDPMRQVKKHVGQSKTCLAIEQMIALGLIEVTVCPPGAVTNLNPRRGSVLPRHLHPDMFEVGV